MIIKTGEGAYEMKKTAFTAVLLIMIISIIAGFTACSGKTEPAQTEESVTITETLPATGTVPSPASEEEPVTDEEIPETPKFSRVMWEDAESLSDYLKKEVENYGSLNVGKNTVSNNGCCYSFTASSAGYYTVDPGYNVMVAFSDKMISNTVPKGKAMFYGLGGAFSDGLWHYVGEEISDTMPLYLEKGDVIYLRFHDIDVEKEGNNLVEGLRTAVIDYLGEITTASFDLGNICLDDCFIDGNIINVKANTPVEIAFSQGQRYKKTYLRCSTDSFTPGEHTLNVELVSGRGFKTKVNFYRLSDVIEKVEVPASYIPMVKMRIGESEGTVGSYPDYINVTLKDGTVRKAQRMQLDEDSEASYYEFNYSGDANNTLHLLAQANDAGRPVIKVVYYDNSGSDSKPVVLAELDAIRT